MKRTKLALKTRVRAALAQSAKPRALVVLFFDRSINDVVRARAMRRAS